MRVMLLAGTTLLFGVALQAGTITQNASFSYQAHASTETNYSQLSPALAPLNEAVFTVSATGNSDVYQVTNTSAGSLSVTVFIDTSLFTDAGGASSLTTVPLTLGPGASQFYQPSQNWYGSLPVTTNLSTYLTPGGSSLIGTGQVAPYGNYTVSITTTNPLFFTVSDVSSIGNVSGTETVAYAYGTTLTVPEPASLIMLSLGLAGIAGMVWRRRSAA